jgi:membrane-anchored protein YejM (alkaline phosphatase superfamily)
MFGNDHFTQQLFEDVTFEEFQQMRNEAKRDEKLEAETEKLEKEARRNKDFDEMIRIDAEIEALGAERENLNQLRAQITKQYDLRELDIRQEYWTKQREFDAIFSKYNLGHPYTRNTAHADKITNELRQKGAKIEALELPILKTQLSPSAQLLWEKDFKPKPGS